MRSIGGWTHGILDYLTVIIFLIGPSVGGFAGRQAAFCYSLAAIHLVLTLVTKFPLGAMKVVSFWLHGSIELIVSILLILLPWIAGFSRGVHSRNFFVLIGALVFLVWLLTDYRNLRSRAPLASAPKP